MAKQAYQYVVFLQEKRNNDGEIMTEASVIIPVTTVLASDHRQAELLAGRAIPVEYEGKLDEVTVVVRDF